VTLVMLGGVHSSIPAEPSPPPNYQQWVPGLLSRPVFKTSETGNTTVEVVDLLVGPGHSSQPIRLAGGALLDVQSGSASLIVDGKAQRIQAGSVVPLAQNQKIAFDNKSEPRALVARLILLSRTGN
jgi:hypothetical protein